MERKRVLFSPSEVSEVHYREKVDIDEKSLLFYNHSEEVKFTEEPPATGTEELKSLENWSH